MINIGRQKTILIFLFLQIIHADDAYLGTVGGDVYPIYSADVQMIKERIHIEIRENGIKAKCRFWFHNKGKTDHIKMGFPALEESPVGRNMMVTNFKCYHDGKEIETSLANTVTTFENEPGYEEIKKWYYWYIKMEVNDTCLIENTYDGKLGGTSWGWISAHYTIATGATWSGPIEDGYICFDHSHLATTRFIQKKHLKNIDTSKIKIAYHEDSTTFSFKKYKPKKNDSFTLHFLSFWDDNFCDEGAKFYEYVKKQCLNGFTMSKTDWRLMRNEIFAHHGYVFKDSELNNFFNKRQWYQANQSFNLDSLNCYEKSIINVIKDK